MTRFFLILFLGLWWAPTAWAYQTVPVTQSSPFDIATLESVVPEQWHVGTLNHFPHTFEFTLDEPTVLRVQAMVPTDAPESEQVSLIAIKEVERGVKEVMRRTADRETWTEYKDPDSGLRFLVSTEYEDQLEPGVYRIEVSNPLNEGRYVLALGTDEIGGYLQRLRSIKMLRTELGLSVVPMVFNKYIFVPLFAFASFAFFVWYRRRVA